MSESDRTRCCLSQRRRTGYSRLLAAVRQAGNWSPGTARPGRGCEGPSARVARFWPGVSDGDTDWLVRARRTASRPALRSVRLDAGSLDQQQPRVELTRREAAVLDELSNALDADAETDRCIAHEQP